MQRGVAFTRKCFKSYRIVPKIGPEKKVNRKFKCYAIVPSRSRSRSRSRVNRYKGSESLRTCTLLFLRRENLETVQLWIRVKTSIDRYLIVPSPCEQTTFPSQFWYLNGTIRLRTRLNGAWQKDTCVAVPFFWKYDIFRVHRVPATIRTKQIHFVKIQRKHWRRLVQWHKLCSNVFSW